MMIAAPALLLHQLLSNCSSVVFSKDTISVCTVTSCDTDSIVDQQDFDPIDLLPHDFSSSNDMENFDVETILCRPCQVDTDCSCTVNATTIGIQNKDHTEIQIECGVNGQQSIVGWLRISERLNL